MLTIKGRCGPSYRINDPGNGVIGKTLQTGEPYEAKLLYYLHRRFRGGVAADAGAHVGNHTLWFGLALEMEVLAFEPVEHHRLMENVQLNPELASRVRVWPQALGEDYGWAIPKGKGVLESCGPNMEGAVPVVPLDGFDLMQLDLFKIDVEGWEPQVLLGAANTIKRCQPVIYAEERDEAAAERNQQTFEMLGYKKTGQRFGATPMLEWEPA